MIWHPHIWMESGVNWAFLVVEQQCLICRRYRHWAGKLKDHPRKGWAPGRAPKITKQELNAIFTKATNQSTNT